MKSKTVLALSSLLIASMLLVVPVSAGKDSLEFRAIGKITEYDYHITPESSQIREGTWRVVIKDGVVDFEYNYKELNIIEAIELSPAGSIDHFKAYLDESATYDIHEDYVEIWGELHVDKMMWFLDDYTPYEPLPDWFDPAWAEGPPVAWIRDFSVTSVYIKITPDDFIRPGGNLDIVGTTLSYQNYT